MSQRHKHADLIHAWAEGAEIEVKAFDGSWSEPLNNSPVWFPDYEYRIKPEEPRWWENIPEHGVLVKPLDASETECFILYPDEIEEEGMDAKYWVPLTNEEIERFKR